LKPLESLSWGSRFMGSGLDGLAELAANEIAAAVREELAKMDSSDSVVTLHCIAHSMGGIVLRGALPALFEQLRTDHDGQLRLGKYVSLAVPHLGIQATLRAPLQMWKNLSCFTAPCSSQLVQLSLQDQDHYLPALAAEGSHLDHLRAFESRICALEAPGDPLIPVASGVIDPAADLGPHVPSDPDSHVKRLDEKSASAYLVNLWQTR